MNVRPMTDADFPAVAELLAVDEEHLLGRPSRVTAIDVKEYLSRTTLETESWLYEDDGTVCAAGWCNFRFGGGEVGFAAGIVRPGWKGRGIGGELVDRSEAHASAEGLSRLQQFAVGPDEAAARLFRSRGYAEVRRFYEMAIELTEPPPAPGVAVESFDPAEARAFHAALEEAFQDHWEHHPTPFDDWWARHSANPNGDLSLWFLIRDGDEIAAAVRNDPNRNGGGYVASIGVRRPWRGRGYAKALLQHTFREFYAREMPRVTLGVDAQNPTGATQLYERVGMHVEQENVLFEKVFAQ